VEHVLPALAEGFRPTFIVSQHGCDTHAWDPLAHLRLTTAAYERAGALIDELAHEHAEGRWFATGGGGYDAYRVVPRSWAIVWLAQAHLPVPERTPMEWRQRWSEEAEAHGQAPMPVALIDPPGSMSPDPADQVASHLERAQAVVAEALRRQSAA